MKNPLTILKSHRMKGRRAEEARTFDRLVAAGNIQDAEAFAFGRIDAGIKENFYVDKLFKIYDAHEQHEKTLALRSRYAGRPVTETYACALAIARAMIVEGLHQEASEILPRLILEHTFSAPLQLYRRLPRDLISIDLAVASFHRSKRSISARINQSPYVADIATAAGDPRRAEAILLQALRWLDANAISTLPKKSSPIGGAIGDTALVDLHEMMMPDTPFFLISGTLLGLVREKRLLGHDKDIDVGVLGDELKDEIEKKVEASKTFRKIYIPSKDIIKLKHKNGVAVDIFFHHREPDGIWHGSHLHAWDNSVWWKSGEEPFATIRHAGKDFLVPTDSDRYLTENYGDWRTPQKNYDASMEAPNRRIRNPELVRVHWQKLVLRYFLNGEFPMLSKAVDLYAAEFGDDEFITTAARQFLRRDPARIALPPKTFVLSSMSGGQTAAAAS